MILSIGLGRGMTVCGPNATGASVLRVRVRRATRGTFVKCRAIERETLVPVSSLRIGSLGGGNGRRIRPLSRRSARCLRPMLSREGHFGGRHGAGPVRGGPGRGRAGRVGADVWVVRV